MVRGYISPIFAVSKVKFKKMKIMKISMIDKVLAIGLVLAVYGITETVDYNQIREEYQWDLEGAGDLGESFRMWD